MMTQQQTDDMVSRELKSAVHDKKAAGAGPGIDYWICKEKPNEQISLWDEEYACAIEKFTVSLRDAKDGDMVKMLPPLHPRDVIVELEEKPVDEQLFLSGC